MLFTYDDYKQRKANDAARERTLFFGASLDEVPCAFLEDYGFVPK